MPRLFFAFYTIDVLCWVYSNICENKTSIVFKFKKTRRIRTVKMKCHSPTHQSPSKNLWSSEKQQLAPRFTFFWASASHRVKEALVPNLLTWSSAASRWAPFPCWGRACWGRSERVPTLSSPAGYWFWGGGAKKCSWFCHKINLKNKKKNSTSAAVKNIGIS